MKTKQYLWKKDHWFRDSNSTAMIQPQVVLVFGHRDLLPEPEYFNEMQQMYPNSNIAICSTSGEIYQNQVLSGAITATAIEFEKTHVEMQQFEVNSIEESETTGKKIARYFNKEKLRALFVLSDGQIVNGGDLVSGINSVFAGSIPVTGGLAGDEDRFEKTLVGLNQLPTEGKIVIMALYGNHIRIGHGSKGGWDAFGPERKVTRSEANVLYELDGKNALELYKEYLGEKAKDLPASALLFPLNLTQPETGDSIVRTILTVDENKQSMTFAGNIPAGSTVRLMKANFDRLIDGSANAASDSIHKYASNGVEPELAILVSCVGRKLVLGQLIADEVEEVVSVIGKNTCYTGFYSYGEISPLVDSSNCQLHNQTMTITTFREE